MSEPWSPYDSGRVALPGRCERDAYCFLTSLDSGGIGGGAAMMDMGASIPRIRELYYAELARAEMSLGALNLPPEQLDRWKVEERIRIAKLLRRQQGLLPSIILEWRDRSIYGPGGRTVDNLLAHKIASAAEKGVHLDEHAALSSLGRSWNAPNPAVTQAARAARYLKYGGRVFFVAGLGSSAYTIATAPEQQRLKVATREGVGLGMGALGSAAAVGLVIGFGVVTGGWGLIAVGLIGGAAGGAIGEYGVERVLFSHDSAAVESQLHAGGMVTHDMLTGRLPAR